ncbi:hypothetical protein [Pedobacter cryoconitis]|nr:hypothetical protein [Pedobacter cryoconitis]
MGQQPVKVDGVSDEWHEPLSSYNAATKVTTRKLMSGGLTLDIN